MQRMTVRRKLAIATWSAPQEGNIYGKLTVDVTQALAYLRWKRETTGEKVTLTHLVGLAAGRALSQAPGLNGRLLFGRYIPHETVDVSFLVVLEGGENLAKAKVEQIHQKSVAEIARELRTLAERLRAGKDEAFKKSQGPLAILPTWIIRPLVWLTGWLTGALGVNMAALGLERFPFGACVITNVGVFGLDEGWAPPTPFARAPVFLLMGAVRPQPTVIGGQIVARKLMSLCATIDHRFMDGAQGAVLARVVRSIFTNPWQLDDLEGPPAGWVDPGDDDSAG